MDGLTLKDENYKVHLVNGPKIKLIYLNPLLILIVDGFKL